jgi:hypothetical protein
MPYAGSLFSDQFADLVHEKKRCGDKWSENDDPDGCEARACGNGSMAGVKAVSA